MASYKTFTIPSISMENIRHELLLFSSTSTVSSTSSIILRHSVRTKRYRHFFRAFPLFLWELNVQNREEPSPTKLELCVSLLNMGYIWNPNMPKPFRYQPRTYNQHANLSQESKLLVTLWADHCRYCAAPALETKAFLFWSLQIAAASKFCSTQDKRSFHCCDGQLFANLNCRVAKCANWFATPFYDCCQAKCLQPQLQRSKMCKWCANSFHSETKSMQPQFPE